MECPSCSRVVESHWNFCKDCGKPLRTVIPPNHLSSQTQLVGSKNFVTKAHSSPAFLPTGTVSSSSLPSRPLTNTATTTSTLTFKNSLNNFSIPKRTNYVPKYELNNSNHVGDNIPVAPQSESPRNGLMNHSPNPNAPQNEFIYPHNGLTNHSLTATNNEFIYPNHSPTNRSMHSNEMNGTNNHNHHVINIHLSPKSPSLKSNIKNTSINVQKMKNKFEDSGNSNNKPYVTNPGHANPKFNSGNPRRRSSPGKSKMQKFVSMGGIPRVKSIQPINPALKSSHKRTSPLVDSSNPKKFTVKMPPEPQKIVNSSANESAVRAGVDTDDTEKYTLRKHIAQEILDSEKTYRNFINVLIEVYKIPMLEAINSGEVRLRKDLAEKIYCNIEELLSLNAQIIEGLEYCMKNWTNETRLGDSFLKLIPSLRTSYKVYAVKYQTAIEILGSTDSNTSVTAFLDKCREDPKSNTQPVRSLLIMPCQRIPRYILLLQDLLKNTPPHHPDFEDLQQALEETKDVANVINQAISEYQNMVLMSRLRDQFLSEEFSQLLQPPRILIKQGPLLKICRKKRKTRMFFLFSDLLVYATTVVAYRVPAEDMYILPRQISLESVSVTAVPDNELKKIQFAFSVQSNPKSFIVIAPDQDSKQDWMDKIHVACQTLPSRQERSASFDSTSSEAVAAPIWIPDDEATMCTLCSAEFTLLVRKHHCRKCGQVFCSACSSQKKVLEALGPYQLRVCDKCFPRKQNNTSELWNRFK